MAKFAYFRLLTAFIILLTMFCGASHGVAGEKSMEVKVFYRERIALPPGSTLTVLLEDVSKMDVAATKIASKTISISSAPPYAVELRYDEAAIDQKFQYGLRARIENQGKLLFINTNRVDPFAATPGEPIQLMVKSVQHKNSPQASRPVLDTTWILAELGGSNLTLPPNHKKLTLTLSKKEQQIHGFSGCNNFTGGYELAPPQLRFTKLASTQKMCVDNKLMQQEQEFLHALNQTVRVQITNTSLALTDSAGQALARFKRAD